MTPTESAQGTPFSRAPLGGEDLTGASAQSSWNREMESFQAKAMLIRRILERFKDEDVSTRLYLWRYVDEEWCNLQRSYEALRTRFSSREQS